LLSKASITNEIEVLQSRCNALIERKRRDMESLQHMIDSIAVESIPSQQVVTHIESLVM